ncbi:MAG: 3-hydroxybutyryl-CoA dehydrogenase [bacterium]|nr:3-hydroxybutyryl-CoA dehydrogenase [bacterium]
MQEIVIVVGAGTMGAGIACVAARAGYIVEIVEPDAAARERGRARIERDASRGGDAASVLARIRWSDAVPERSEAAIAIEAVPERLELKRAVFAQLARALDPQALLATNTSSLAVAEIASGVPAPDRVVGLHFFNPPVAMKLVEIVEIEQTSDDALAAARAFVARLEKTAVVTADTPGFIVNRVARPFYLQAMRALDRGVASVEELDALARGAGFRMGPFELMDMIGLDVNLATSESVYERVGAARLEPQAMQRALVEQGRLGRKSGIGFYDYANGDPERLELVPEGPSEEKIDECVTVIGFGAAADALVEELEARYADVRRVENDELLDEISPETTIAIDVGDGVSDRAEILAELDTLLAPEAIVACDAYATDLAAATRKMKHPDRVVGYGVLGALASQRVVEIVDFEKSSDDALAVAQELFEALGKGVVLVEDVPGLFLGRVVGAIVNEAVIAVQENVATPDDIDLAMRLGVNYPIGPLAWGREIGGARIAQILRRVAKDDGDAFAPHRALWVLDADDGEDADEPIDVPMERPVL